MSKQVNRKGAKWSSGGIKKMTYEDRWGQERLLPSYLYHDHRGSTAIRITTLILALIGGEMSPQRSLKPRVSGPIWSHTDRDIQGWTLALRDATAKNVHMYMYSVHVQKIQWRRSWTVPSKSRWHLTFSWTLGKKSMQSLLLCSRNIIITAEARCKEHIGPDGKSFRKERELRWELIIWMFHTTSSLFTLWLGSCLDVMILFHVRDPTVIYNDLGKTRPPCVPSFPLSFRAQTHTHAHTHT